LSIDSTLRYHREITELLGRCRGQGGTPVDPVVAGSSPVVLARKTRVPGVCPARRIGLVRNSGNEWDRPPRLQPERAGGNPKVVVGHPRGFQRFPFMARKPGAFKG